jgi:protein-L-isoaspartate(D-aspartate) O-methyltransferase
MIAEISAEVAATGHLLGTTALNGRTLAALERVPRHEFVLPEQREVAYLNRPLPIGHGQTISQPYIVAIMTDLAQISADARVLEVGTGCGYQTAVMAELAAQVYTVEVVPNLAIDAATRLRRLGYANIKTRVGDGALGWPERAPYAAIVVTAAAPEVPAKLIEQLAPGGRLLIPVDRGGLKARLRLGREQDLLLVSKDTAGLVSKRDLLPVAFVPLVNGRQPQDEDR